MTYASKNSYNKTSKVKHFWLTSKQSNPVPFLWLVCFLFKGLLHQNGTCVPLKQCGCVYPQHQSPGHLPTAVIVPQGATVTLGCSTWLEHCPTLSRIDWLNMVPWFNWTSSVFTCSLCQDGTLECDSRECEGKRIRVIKSCPLVMNSLADFFSLSLSDPQRVVRVDPLLSLHAW